MAEMLRALESSVRLESGSPTNRSKAVPGSHSELFRASEAVPDLIRVKTAVATVYDKTGLAELGRELANFNIEVIATEGTAAHLQSAQSHGLAVTNLTRYTRYPENLNGRLKTLHPKIQAGVLAIQGHHDEILKKENVDAKFIELVIVNLYPFEQAVAKNAEFYECIENIDIGGPALIRAGAKNHACVTVVCDPSDYGELISELKANGGQTSLAFRRRCARKVFELTTKYDAAIAEWFRSRS